jgi:hypothetical protein
MVTFESVVATTCVEIWTTKSLVLPEVSRYSGGSDAFEVVRPSDSACSLHKVFPCTFGPVPFIFPLHGLLLAMDPPPWESSLALFFSNAVTIGSAVAGVFVLCAASQSSQLPFLKTGPRSPLLLCRFEPFTRNVVSTQQASWPSSR